MHFDDIRTACCDIYHDLPDKLDCLLLQQSVFCNCIFFNIVQNHQLLPEKFDVLGLSKSTIQNISGLPVTSAMHISIKNQSVFLVWTYFMLFCDYNVERGTSAKMPFARTDRRTHDDSIACTALA